MERFLKRHNLTKRRVTGHSSGKELDVIDRQLWAFRRFITKTRRAKLEKTGSDFMQPLIINMDETPVWFDMACNYTIDVRGVKTVKAVQTNKAKERVSVVLTCGADGTKYKPMIIFGHRTTVPDDIPAGIFATTQQSGFQDETTMLAYLKNIWRTKGGNGPADWDRPILAVLDSHKSHLTEKVKAEMSSHYKATLAVIPGGCTSYAQPLDLGVNRSFKSKVRFCVL